METAQIIFDLLYFVVVIVLLIVIRNKNKELEGQKLVYKHSIDNWKKECDRLEEENVDLRNEVDILSSRK